MGSYHFIGIKGSGMSALAQLLHDLGHRVQGEDVEEAIFTQASLEARNIPIYAFGEAPLANDMIVIASNAFDDAHSSLELCRRQGLTIQRYHHFLAAWMKDYTSIAITGSHGKTTTTGMLVHALGSSWPTCSLIGDGTGSGAADARFFVFESCEYKRHFLAYQPDIAIITNIDFDHPDYFRGVDDVRHAFEQMTATVGKQIVACGDDEQVRLLQSAKPVLYYGFGDHNELRADSISVHGEGVSFDVIWQGAKLDRFTIPVYGRHNVLNTLAVIGVGLVLGLDMAAIRQRVSSFGGVKRRFTESGWRTNIVIDDYAHHPSEIRATLDAARSKYPDRRIVSVFQPHTFTRLERLIDDFAASLIAADDVFLCPIFGSARERAGSVSIENLRDRIPRAQLLSESSIGQLGSYEDSVLVFMGAGDIQKYQRRLVEL